MKTTQSKAMLAYKAIIEITKNLSFPFQSARALLRLRKELEMTYEFQLQEEQKLMEEYQPKIENGNIVMPYDENDEEVKARAKQFFDKLKELSELEVEVENAPLKVSPPDKGSVAPDTLALLEDFVEWED